MGNIGNKVMAVAAACSLFAACSAGDAAEPPYVMENIRRYEPGCSSGDDRVCASVQLGYPVFSDAESSQSLNSNVSDLLLDGFGSVDSLCNAFFGQWAGYRETVFSDTLGHAHVDMSHDQEEDEYFPEVWYYSRTADVCGHGRGFVSLMFRTATNSTVYQYGRKYASLSLHDGRLLAPEDVFSDTSALRRVISSEFMRSNGISEGISLAEQGVMLSDGLLPLTDDFAVCDTAVVFHYHMSEIAPNLLPDDDIRVPVGKIEPFLIPLNEN